MPSSHTTSTPTTTSTSGPVATPKILDPVTPFEVDVAKAIDSGLAYLDSVNAYTNPGNGAGNAAGITTLALLEKRPSGNPADPPQGYNGASSADQGRLRRSVAFILTNYAASGFYAYSDGGMLATLSAYILSGGPDSCGPAPNPNACPGTTPVELQNISHSLIQTVDAMVDRTLTSQRTVANGYVTGTPAWDQGYWCYTNGGCRDSSTTQYASVGLAAVQAVYNNPTFGDPGSRLPKIKNALQLAAQAYALNTGQGSENTKCDPGDPSTFKPGYSTAPNGSITGVITDPKAFGHGYHSAGENYAPSLQQTGSGLFVQVLGGGNINTAKVQAYQRWVYDHYRYTDIGGINGAGQMYNSWPSSYFYYLWSSFKGIEFMVQQGIIANPGNLTTSSYGTLDPTAAPVCPDRQVHRDPAALQRVPLFGAGGAGFYGAESKSQYFDYAYTLLSYQCPTGTFLCDADPKAGGFQNPGLHVGSWDGAIDSTAYALLVLQRATGVIAPTASLSSDLLTQTVAKTVKLTWSSTNANSCAASGGKPGDGWTGGNLASSGTLTVTESAPGPVTYTISCAAGAQTAQAQVTVTWTKVNFLLCDVDGNGVIDNRDITMIMQLIGSKAPPAPAAADFDGNGIISINDARNCALRCTLKNCALDNGP
jgi:hypothetical protein